MTLREQFDKVLDGSYEPEITSNKEYDGEKHVWVVRVNGTLFASHLEEDEIDAAKESALKEWKEKHS